MAACALYFFEQRPVPEPMQYQIGWSAQKGPTQKAKAHYIAELTQHRLNLRHTLVNSNTPDHIVKSAESFLSLLVDVTDQLKDNPTIKCKAQMYQWRPSMHQNNLEFASTPDIHMDLSFAFLTVGYLHCNYARFHMNKPDLSFDERAKLAVTSLRTAAGVFERLHADVTTKWINLPRGRPLEALDKVVRSLSTLAMVQAQQVGIVKGITDQSLGKPLLAKLYVDVTKKYEAIHDNLASLHAADKAKMHPDLLHFVQFQVLLSRAQASAVLGEVAYAEEKYGEAAVFLEKAMGPLKTLRAVPIKSQGHGLGDLHALAESEHVRIAKLYQLYKHDNDTIYFKETPPMDRLRFPEPKSLFKPIPYELPALPVQRVDLKAP